MVIMGIDASTACTGWAIIDAVSDTNIKVIAFGEIELSKFKKKKFPFEYILVFFQEITKLINKYKPEKIYLEDIFYSRNVITYKALARMRGICELTVLLTGIKTIKSFSATVLRENIFGNGKLEKSEICDKLEKRFNITLGTSGMDQSDSLLVALGGALDTYAQITIRPRKRKSRPKSSNASRSRSRQKRSK